MDAVGYLSTGQIFVSFMSGNTTKMGVDVVRLNWHDATFAFVTIVLFTSGVILGTLVARKAGLRRKTVTLLVVTILLLASAAFRTAGLRIPSAAVLVLAMGVENAIFQRRGSVTVGLTYVTGTLVRMGQHLAAALTGGPRWAWLPFAGLWLGFAAGALTGAVASGVLADYSLWPAAFVCATLTWVSSKTKPRFH